MSSKKRKVNTKSSKTESALNDHRSGDSDLGFSNGLRRGNDADKSPGTSYSGGDNGSASSAFSPKLADSASASPLSVNSLSNQSGRVANRIGESEGGVPHKSGRSDLHQPYVDHFGSPSSQKFPSGSVPSQLTQHGSDFFPGQFQPRVGHNFPPGFHHPTHLSAPNAYPSGPPFSNPYSQQQPPYHQPMNQQPLRPRPQAQPSLPSSYASSTPMLTQLLQYPTSKEKPIESGPGGDYVNSVKHFFGKKPPNQWPSGPPNMAAPNHLLNRMPGVNHGFRQDPQMSQSLPFNNQFFQPLDTHQQQSVNHSTNRPPPLFNNHPPHSKSPDVIISNNQDGEPQHAKSSQHKKKSGAKKSVKSRSRMKRRPDVTKQDYSSGDEKKDDDDDGSDSSSGTEVYSQITPTSTPPLSPQPAQTSEEHNNSDDPHDKSHAPGFGPDMARFQQGPNNGGFPPPGPMMRQPNPYQNQPPFLPGQPIRHNPHMGGFYSPYQTSSMAPSKSTESDAYGVFKGGPSYHHQQGTIGHHGGMANSGFNAFPRPGMNGPSMPYPGSSESSHQPPNAPPFYRPTNNFQAKSDQPPFGGNRPEFFPPNHPGFAGGYPYDMPGYRPELGYRHPGDVYRQEGPYPNFPGFRPDGPQFPGYRMPPQDGRMYRNPEHQSAHRAQDGPVPNSNPGEMKPNDANPRSEKTSSSQQGNFVEGSNQKQGEENLDPVRPSLDSQANSSTAPGKSSIPTSRTNNQWVTNMQGMMSGGSVVEKPQNDHGQPVLSIASVKQVMGDGFEAAAAKDPSQHNAFGRGLPPHDLPDTAPKDMFQHPQHFSRPANEFYHSHYRESPDGRSSVSDIRSEVADPKLRNSRPSSTSGPRPEYKHKSSERAASKIEFLRQDVYSPSMTPTNHMSMSPVSQNDYDMSHQKFSNNPAFMKILEMGQEPDRVGLLERLFSFMNHRGTPVTAVPMICKQTIDLYSLYFLVRERGGMIEVTKNKKWRDVSSALSLGSSSSAGFTLKRNYGKYIYPYECKFDRGDIDPAPFLATLEISGSKKEVGKKSSSDRIQAASDLDNNSASNSYQDDKDSAYFGRGPASPGSYGGEYGDDSLSQHPPPYSGRPLQSPEYSNRPFHNTDRFDMISPHHEGAVDGPHGRCPPPLPSYRPYRHLGGDQYPPHFDQRRMPENSSEGFQLPGGFWSPPNQPFPQPPNYPFYGAHPGHFGPYPPRFNVRAEMERPQRFPSMGYPPTVRMYSFPSGSVESVRVKNVKKRRICHRDIGPVDPWRLLMSLKSGLLCEASWALDVLMILTRDDQTHSSVCLSNMPGMLETLVEHFKSSLVSIFPKSKEQFEELEISADVQSIHSRQLKREQRNETDDVDDDNKPSFHLETSEISEMNELATQKIKRKQAGVKYSNKSSCEDVLENYATKEWDSHKNLESSSFDWQMGRCDTLMHIVASVGDANDARLDKESEANKTKFFGHERLSLLNSMQKSDLVKTSESGYKIDLNIKAEIYASMNNVNIEDEEMSSDPPANKDENDEAVTIKTEDDAIAKQSDETSTKSSENSTKTEEGKEISKNGDSKRCDSTVYNRNDSLIKEMLEVKSLGMDADLSNTFSCSQIEALVATCLGDKAVIPFEAKHDIEYKKIKRKRQASLVAWDEEIFIPDEGPLCSAGESRRELTSRCLCISTILRNLSFAQSNDVEMSKHSGLILVLGKLLRMRHYHNLRELKPTKPSEGGNCAEEIKKEDPIIPSLEKITDDVLCCGEDNKNCQVPNLEMPDDLVMFMKDEKKEADNSDCEETYESWWWYTVEVLRENALVVFANVSGQLDLSAFPEEICIPVLDGLLHWMVCQVGNQDDEDIAYSNPHFYVQHSSLSFRRLVLEALCKLCILDSNVDLLLAVPPFSRILLLFTRLVGLFEERQPLVVREMAAGLLSRLVPADPIVARALALHRSFIPSIIDFLEASIDGRISTHDAAQHNPHFPYNPNINANTSVDVLCRVASILRFMSEVSENETLIVRHQQRLLHLMTSPALNRTVASVLSSVLALCS